MTRYGRADTSFSFESKREGTPTDLERGTRRARAAALLAMALPGSLYVYQGEELGLPEVEDIPHDRRQDPMWHRSGGLDPGRDGCRIPIPWEGDAPPYGFSNGDATPWLEPPVGWAQLTVAAQSEQAASMLSLYRTGLRFRRAAPWEEGAFQWVPSAPSVLAFSRGERFSCFVNFGPSRRLFQRAPTCSSPAMSWKEVRSQPTRPSGSAGRTHRSRSTTICTRPPPGAQERGRTMKSTRRAATVAVVVTSLLAACVVQGRPRRAARARRRSRSASRR